jgi:hypothetical protein
MADDVMQLLWKRFDEGDFEAARELARLLNRLGDDEMTDLFRTEVMLRTCAWFGVMRQLGGLTEEAGERVTLWTRKTKKGKVWHALPRDGLNCLCGKTPGEEVRERIPESGRMCGGCRPTYLNFVHGFTGFAQQWGITDADPEELAAAEEAKRRFAINRRVMRMSKVQLERLAQFAARLR